MRSNLNAEESLAAFETQKDLLHKQIKVKFDHKFKDKPNRVREITHNDKIYHRWTSAKPLVRYYTEGRDVKIPRDVLQESSPYKLLATSWIKLKRPMVKEPVPIGMKHYQQLTQKGKESADINSRVYIPPDDRPIPLGISDFNPDYFSIVKGRKTHRQFSKQHFINTLKSTFQYNIMTSVYRDKVKFVNQEFLVNFNLISSLYDSLREAEETLKGFSYHDETETLKTINTFKLFWRAYLENMEIIENVKVKTVGIMNDVQYTWDRLLTRLHCKQVLYEISPPSWKKWYDQKKKAWNYSDMESYKALNKQFNDYIAAVKIPDPEISKIMEQVRNMYTSLGPNEIYYSSMKQVEEVFKDLEGQATLALEYTALISNHREQLVTLMKETEKYYSHETKILENLIHILSKKIEYNKSRANELEERLNLKADTWFKDTIIGEETLMVKSLVQCLYDEIVGQRSRVMSNREMMEQLEAKMIRLKTDIGQFDMEARRIMSSSLKKKEELAVSRAEQAKSKEIALKKLLKQMETSMQEVPQRTWRLLRPRSQPPEEPTDEYSQIHDETKPSLFIRKTSIPIQITDDEWDCQSYDPTLGMPKTRDSIRLTDFLMDM